MADYDSDEDVADLEYTTTTTLLGYAESTPSDDATSHLGGIPTWFDDSMDSRLAKCLSCNNLMPLLLQLDGNLPDSPHHRRMLYLFGCRSKACRKKPGSIRAIRGVKSTGIAPPNTQKEATPAEPKKIEADPPKPKSNMGDLIFGSSSSENPTNPFASSQANPFAKSNPFAKDEVSSLAKSFAQVASISVESKPAPAPAPEPEPAEPALIGPPSPWPPATEIPQYPNFFLDASYEELEPDALTLQSQKLAKTIKMDALDDMDEDITPSSSKKAATAAASSSSSKASKEKEFESVMNATFLHFQNITSQNPEQVLRYERKGTPLLYSRDDSIGKLLVSSQGSDISLSKLPRCSNCNKGKCFEVQLMPHTISVLEEGADAALDEGMVWGTIIVATCEADCAITGSEKGKYVEEWVGVQWETD
ncbi:hypothetical protein H072_7090 [Dactylellina haptotyla CBS 200.50]|uniref:Programmed cell death protein 2 C-terminal domain-containing protein n=1 Tax=Dactylellina haptotyla (strain CBS 200.50) TaxID=1284197 RepID=S8A8F8_DACHA|nr:hypothetical protein H072_7090 [Dactylellina haptotyla CBS 200.50]